MTVPSVVSALSPKTLDIPGTGEAAAIVSAGISGIGSDSKNEIAALALKIKLSLTHRISCPFLVRGKWGRKINMVGEGSDSETETDAVAASALKFTRADSSGEGKGGGGVTTVTAADEDHISPPPPPRWGGREHPGGQASVDKHVREYVGVILYV